MQYQLDPSDILHAPLQDFLVMGGEVVLDTDKALVLRYEGLYYGAGDCDQSENFCNSLMALSVDAGATERMVQAGLFDDVTPVWQYVYAGPVPSAYEGELTIAQLTEKDLPFLLAHYDHPSATPRHMSERLQKGLMLGAFQKGECMGFAGLHQEGAIGMLHVLPAYRRRGVATALMGEMVRRLLLMGRIPYTHVYPTNTTSMALQESLGFVRSEETVTWLCKHNAYRSAYL